MSNPIFWKKNKNIFKMASSEIFTQDVKEELIHFHVRQILSVLFLLPSEKGLL